MSFELGKKSQDPQVRDYRLLSRVVQLTTFNLTILQIFLEGK